MRRAYWAGLVALLGCHGVNGAFDPDGASATGGDGPGATSQPSTGPGDDNPTADATADGNGSGDDTMPPDASGPGDDCPDQADLGLRMLVHAGDVQALPNCRSSQLSTQPGLAQYPPPDRIELEQCQIPGCEPCSGTTLDIDFDGSVVVPQPLPTCGNLEAWDSIRPSGECEWAGLIMSSPNTDGGLLPSLIVSSTLDVPPLPDLKVELRGIGECGTVEAGTCDGARRPGHYALSVGGSMVTVEASPVEVTVDLANGTDPLTYEVHNYVSRINDDCRLQLLWTARRVQD